MTKWQKLEENRDDIISRYEGGEDTASIARTMGCNCGYVWTFLKKAGVELRVRKKVEPNTDAILAFHKEGLSAYAINRRLGLCKNTAERALRSANIDISHRRKQRADPVVNHRQDIIARYLGGDGVHVIAKTYHTQDATIVRSLKRWGVELRSLRDYSYPVNESFFDLVDRQEKAYVLGFWMADGCNMSHVPCVALAITDHDILLAIAQAMGYGGKLHEEGPNPKQKRKKTQWKLSLGSRKLSDAMTALGCVRGKTYVAAFPTDEQVPPEFHRHLIRGWMDGDGTITAKPGGKNWHMRIVGTEAVCLGMSACVSRHLGYMGSVCPVHKGEKHTTWGFTIAGRYDLKTFLDWVYRDSTIHLSRKYDRYLDFLAS